MLSIIKSTQLIVVILVTISLGLWFLQNSNNSSSISDQETVSQSSDQVLFEKNKLVKFDFKHFKKTRPLSNKNIELLPTMADEKILPDELVIMEQQIYTQRLNNDEEPRMGSPEHPYDIQTEDELPAATVATVEIVPEELAMMEYNVDQQTPMPMNEQEPVFGSPEWPDDIEPNDLYPATFANEDVLPKEVKMMEQR